MKTTIIIFFLLISSFAKAQESGTWFAFWDKENFLLGFKNKDGVVKIDPQFMGLTTALRFNNIIAVMEETNDSPASYYLLKNGKKFGVDSLYVLDMSFDCESEGFIRFRDSKTDMVGYFDSFGNVVIPAVYNDATPFRNGLAMAITGAKRICWEGGEFSKENPCEHWNWEGGQRMLIDKNNNILIDNFKPSAVLDIYSLQIDDTPSENSTIETFKGIDGKHYSFINVEEHFRNWLFDSLLTDLNKDKLINNSYHKITYWQDSLGWVFEGCKSLVDMNYEVLKSSLLEIKKEHADFFITIDELNPFIYEAEEYDMYFDDCGNAKIWMYPVLQVVINHRIGANFHQDHFEFLRTEDGYKLISLTLRKNELK